MKNRVLKTLLLAALCAVFVLTPACSGKQTDAPAGTAAGTSAITEAPAETEPEYVVPDLNLNGKAVTFLNCENIWGICMDIDTESLTGEALNDAIYNRARKVEDMLNFKMKVNILTCNGSFDKLTTAAHQSILAADKAYDAVYMKAVSDLSMMTDGSLVDLAKISTMDLDKDWWDQNLIDDLSLLGKQYYVTGDLHLGPLECGRCLLFNKVMLKDLKIAEPYDLVTDGKWTLDRFTEYCSAAASLNGASSFAWDKDAKTVYGIAAHSHTIWGLMYSMNVRYTEPDGKGSPQFILQSQENIDRMQAIARLTAQEGVYFKASNSETDAAAGSYMVAFSSNRALFMSSQVKSAAQMREMEADFGMLPLPKYDEAQEQYYTYLTSNNLTLSLPSTNPNPEETGAVIDLLTYQSHVDVIPVYYGTVVEQKGLRDERSIEMLGYIRAGRGINTADFYGWNTKLADELYNKLNSGSGDVASVIASASESVKASITKTVNDLKG